MPSIRPLAALALVALLAMAGALPLAGCRSAAGGAVAEADKLTRDEYVAMVDTCRAVLLHSKIELTDEQREFIRTTAPTFHVRYTGPKEGKYTMVWDAPGGVGISIAGEGRFLERSCRTRIGVTRF